MMKVDKQVAGLLKRYFDYDYKGEIDLDTFKTYASKLSLFPLSFSKLDDIVMEQGYALAYEPLLVYNKEQHTARLTMTPLSGDQVINKLNFDPITYSSTMAVCEHRGYLTSGIVIPIEHGTYTAYSSVLIIAKDFETLKKVKTKYQNINL